MNYTVNQLAKVSGVTVRTLHFYDEVGLLKPSFVAENGYRYYQEKELLILQQILFLRELGFELKQIQHIMNSGDFDKLTALQAHQQAINQKINHLRELLVTLEKTINHLQGKQKMTEQEMFYGLHKYSPEFQQYYRDMMAKVPDKARKQYDQIYEHEKNMSAAEKKKLDQDKQQFWHDLVVVFKKGLAPDHTDVQRVMKQYISFSEHSGVNLEQKNWLLAAEKMRKMPKYLQKTVDRFPEFKSLPQFVEKIKIYEDNPGLNDFLADAMKLYVTKNLS